jgi:hypothetical protein
VTTFKSKYLSDRSGPKEKHQSSQTKINARIFIYLVYVSLQSIMMVEILDVSADLFENIPKNNHYYMIKYPIIPIHE